MSETVAAAMMERERARVDRALAAIVEREVRGLAPPLAEAMEYALATRGKRLRPVLAVAAYRLARGAGGDDPAEAVYRMACALEVVHTYSLVHDDLPCMDDDDLRRGRPTVHRVHGVPLATLAGAALLPLAVRVLLDASAELGLPTEVRATLVSELCRAAGCVGMVGGQWLDLEGEGRGVDGAGLEAIHRAKTGALLTASLRLGALAGEAEQPVLEALTAYGDALGLAFQIADDILDVVGDAASLGKTAGRDEQLNKSSYPSLYGLECARRMARDTADRARQALAGLPAAELAALADYVVDRRS